MSNQFSLFPVLNDALMQSAGIQMGEAEFSYTDDYEDFPLELKEKNESGNTYSGRLRDQRCVWYPETHNLKIRKEIIIKNPEKLFGVDGIVCHDAVIGVAIQWISSKTDHRGSVRCGSIRAADKEFSFTSSLKFDRDFVKGSVQLQTVLYLKKDGTPLADEKHLNNISGTILGVIESCELFIDGNGSIFPISTVYEPDKPLWWVYFDSACDPMNDNFDEENVELLLNSAHPNYNSLKIESSMKESLLLTEILASAMVIIIDSAKDNLGAEWDSLLESKEFTTGSIAEALYYFKNKLLWDLEEPASLSVSIHNYFDKAL